MKKEVFLAIFIGFALGLIITFGIWTANKSLKKLAQNLPDNTPTADASVKPSPTATPTNTNTSSIALSIASPDDETLTNTNTTKVTGKTVSNGVVTITGEIGEQITQADTNGLFSADVPLDSGYNTITVVAFDSSGNSSSQSIIVTYTTSKI